MKKILCMLLSVLMLCSVFSACGEQGEGDNNDSSNSVHVHTFGAWHVTVPASCTASGEESRSCGCGETEIRKTGKVHLIDEAGDCTLCYKTKAQLRLEGMSLQFENEYGALYFDLRDGSVGYRNAASGEVVFTSPGKDATAAAGFSAKEMTSLFVVRYNVNGQAYTLHTSADAFPLSQYYVTTQGVENGICVGFRMKLDVGISIPEFIEKTAFEQKILNPIREGLIADYGTEQGDWLFRKFSSFYNYIDYTTEPRKDKKEALERKYPVLKEKNIDAYVVAVDALASDTAFSYIASHIAAYCPAYTQDELEKDHAFMRYDDPKYLCPTFEGALSFVIDENGLTVDFAPEYIDENDRPGRLENGYKTSLATHLYVLPYLRLQNCGCVRILCEDVQFSQ